MLILKNPTTGDKLSYNYDVDPILHQDPDLCEQALKYASGCGEETFYEVYIDLYLIKYGIKLFAGYELAYDDE